MTQCYTETKVAEQRIEKRSINEGKKKPSLSHEKDGLDS